MHLVMSLNAGDIILLYQYTDEAEDGVWIFYDKYGNEIGRLIQPNLKDAFLLGVEYRNNMKTDI